MTTQAITPPETPEERELRDELDQLIMFTLGDTEWNNCSDEDIDAIRKACGPGPWVGDDQAVVDMICEHAERILGPVQT